MNISELSIYEHSQNSLIDLEYEANKKILDINNSNKPQHYKSKQLYDMLEQSNKINHNIKRAIDQLSASNVIELDCDQGNKDKKLYNKKEYLFDISTNNYNEMDDKNLNNKIKIYREEINESTIEHSNYLQEDIYNVIIDSYINKILLSENNYINNWEGMGMDRRKSSKVLLNNAAIAFPILKINEIKEFFIMFLNKPKLSVFIGLVGSVISFFMGGVDGLLWILFSSGILCLLFGRFSAETKNIPITFRLAKRIQFFLSPFVVVAACSLIGYSIILEIPSSSKLNNFFIMFRGFIISALIFRDVFNVFSGIEQSGFKIPKSIKSLLKAFKNAGDGWKTQFIKTLNEEKEDK